MTGQQLIDRLLDLGVLHPGADQDMGSSLN